MGWTAATCRAIVSPARSGSVADSAHMDDSLGAGPGCLLCAMQYWVRSTVGLGLKGCGPPGSSFFPSERERSRCRTRPCMLNQASRGPGPMSRQFPLTFAFRVQAERRSAAEGHSLCCAPQTGILDVSVLRYCEALKLLSQSAQRVQFRLFRFWTVRQEDTLSALEDSLSLTTDRKIASECPSRKDLNPRVRPLRRTRAPRGATPSHAGPFSS